jgi:EAL domain-containing protein (putative c-di-GMP-specific phosphodiesterase class I)
MGSIVTRSAFVGCSMADRQIVSMPARQPGGATPLCFIVDEDFGLRRELSEELRRQAIDVVDFSNSSRLLSMVDDQNPDIVLINVVGAAPHESLRALMALKDCRYGGAVQLFGNCEPKFLESLKVTGLDCGLRMLPPLRMPIKVAALHGIIREQKLGAPGAKKSGISLKDALVRQSVSFLYQPKIDLKAGIVIGAEVVARIADPQFGIIAPDQFLKGAEQETLADLTRLAIINALKASAHFHQLGVMLEISINVTADVLLQLPMADLIQLHRPEANDWPGLILEIPERQIVNRMAPLQARLPKLRQCGASIAIDNFGRGSFSFAAMSQMSFSEIKIDRSLVEGCASASANANICKAIIQMAHSFGCRAAAVGVSTPADLQLLTQFGCDMGQGFLLGRPMTVQQLDALIARFRDRGDGRPKQRLS